MKQNQTHTTDNSADHTRETDQAVADRQDGAEMEPAVVDVEQIEQMGKDVIESVQCLHELLAARSEALEACRSAVVEQASELEQQQQALEQQAIQLEMADKQSTIENKQADTAVKQSTAVKNFSEIEQNDVENAIQTAELASAAGNSQLFDAAIADIARLLQNGGNPSLTAGAQQV